MSEFNIRATQQVADFLYNFLQLTPIKKTPGGGNSTDESVITYHAEKDDIIFCKKLLQNRKLEKAIFFSCANGCWFLLIQCDEFLPLASCRFMFYVVMIISP